jgi:MFS family permease
MTLSTHRFKLRAAKTMLIASCAWFILDLIFAWCTSLQVGMLILILAGFSQSLCMTPLAAVMLRASEPAYRGRVMGMRMLAIWGLPLGLFLSGPLVESVGYAATAVLYSLLGLALCLFMVVYWRQALWDSHSPANTFL